MQEQIPSLQIALGPQGDGLHKSVCVGSAATKNFVSIILKTSIESVIEHKKSFWMKATYEEWLVDCIDWKDHRCIQRYKNT